MAIHLIFVTGGVCGEKFCHVEIKCGNWKLILFLVNIVYFGTKKYILAEILYLLCGEN